MVLFIERLLILWRLVNLGRGRWGGRDREGAYHACRYILDRTSGGEYYRFT